MMMISSGRGEDICHMEVGRGKTLGSELFPAQKLYSVKVQYRAAEEIYMKIENKGW